MKNENQIEEICRKEGRVQQTKKWLGILFFVAAAIMAVIYYNALSAPITDNGKAAATQILISLSTFAGLIIAGYFYNRFLSKKLDRLWEQKKLLF